MIRSCYIPVLFILLIAYGCQAERTISLQGDEPVAPADFVRFFDPLALPYTLADSSLLAKPNDSLAISLVNLRTLLPDTLIEKFKQKGSIGRFYAIGKIAVPDGETYLLIRQQGRSGARVWVCAVTADNTFVTALQTLSMPRVSDIAQHMNVDRRFLLSVTKQRKNSDGSLAEGKEVFVFNQAAGLFTLIMTEALDEKPTELVNPIDTLPTAHRYAGDYTNGKMNLVSVRDGRRPDRVSFFVHFEKKNGSCVGELKGEAYWKSPRVAEYRQDGDPCVLQFQFAAGSVTLREQRCGSRRGPDCLFDVSFVRKKRPGNKKKG
ncbi:MAG: hypothetical protein ACKOC7_02080 [Sphingomonadales bacterium]